MGINIHGISQTEQELDSARHFAENVSRFTVAADVEYAVYVEFGTIHQQAQPFLANATREVMRNPDKYVDNPESARELIEQLTNAIADAARSNAPVDTGTLRDSIRVEER